MQPSLFFTNSYDITQDDSNWLELKQYSRSYGVDEFLYSLKIILPETLIESQAAILPAFPVDTSEEDYLEENLGSPRLTPLDVYSEPKEFYREFENDLQTLQLPPTEFTLTDYIEITVHTTNHTLRLQIGLPVNEYLYNYYVDGVLTRSPLTYSLGKNNPGEVTTDTLQSDYTQTTEAIYPNNTYFLQNQLADLLTVKNLPRGTVDVLLYSGGVLYAKTSTILGTEHLPVEQFSFNSITLQQLTYGLYILPTYRPEDYIQLLDSYCTSLQDFLQKSFIIPPSTITFPYLQTAVPSVYSYYDVAWSTLALLWAYDTKLSFIGSRYITEIVELLASSINIFTNVCNKTVSNNGFPLITNDLDTTVLISLVFEKFLTYIHDPTIEYLTVIVNLYLESVLSTPESIEDSLPIDAPDKLQTLFHLHLWARAHDKDTDTIQTLTILYKDYATSDDLFFKTAYSFKLFEADGNLNPLVTIANWEYTLRLTDYNDGAWGKTAPSLYYTSWAYILDNLTPIWITSTYVTRHVEAENFTSFIYRRSFKYIPFSEAWFKLETINPVHSNLGALLKAINSIWLPLAYEYACLVISLSLSEAYGVGLDRWGNFFGIPRASGELDQSYKDRLLAFSKLDNLNEEEVSTYVETLRSSTSTEITNSLPTTILVDDVSYTPTDLKDFYDKALLNDPVGVYTDSGFYNLDEELGVVKIDSYEDDLVNHMYELIEVMFGIPVIISNVSSYSINLSETEVSYE